mgnify:CR=1 FL=1
MRRRTLLLGTLLTLVLLAGLIGAAPASAQDARDDYGPHLRLHVMADATEVGVGDPVTYRLTVRNTGPYPTGAVWVFFHAPPGFTVERQLTSGACSAMHHAVLCTLDDLAAESESTFTVVARAEGPPRTAES